VPRSGKVKGKTDIQVFCQFPHLKEKPNWGNYFWARGYCQDTVGIDEDIIRKYDKFQEKEEKGKKICFSKIMYISGNCEPPSERAAFHPPSPS